MYYSIIDPKLNSKFQKQNQLDDEAFIVYNYYYNLKELKYAHHYIINEIFDKYSDKLFDDSLVEFHANFIDRIHIDYNNSFYYQFCKIKNLYQYDEITQGFEQFIINLEISDLEYKIPQLNSAITFMDYCLLAHRLDKGTMNVNDNIIEFITFSKEVFYSLIEKVEYLLDKKYDEIIINYED